MRFSIVMPTYNRGKLLRHSLPTALEQSFDDYEVVVSNNCSTDETDEVIGGFDDARLVCVRPEERLSMVDHWEFAVSHARGEWVLILCDDDALLPDCLRTLTDLADRNPWCRLIQYDRFQYLYDDGVSDDGNFVEIGSRISGALLKLESRRRLNTVFWRMSLEMPKLLNAAAHRSLLERVRERYGRLFGLWAPDVSVGVHMLSLTPSYLKVGPQMLWGATMESYGTGSMEDPGRMLQFYRQFPEFEGRLPLSPYPELLTIGNTIYDTLRRLQKELGEEWSHLDVDPVRFRNQLLGDVRAYAERGHPEYEQIARRIRHDLAALQRSPNIGWQRLRARAGDLPEKIKRLKYGSRSKGRKQKHRFENIHDAARFVGQLERV